MCRESRRESLSYDCKHEKTLLINMKGTGYRLEMNMLTNFKLHVLIIISLFLQVTSAARSDGV